MEADIHDKNTWRQRISQDEHLAMDQFCEHVKQTSSDTALYFKAMYFKSLLLASKPDEKEGVIDRIVLLLDSLPKDTSTAESVASKLEQTNKPIKEADHFFDVVFDGENIGKKYGQFELKQVNLQLRRGEITGVVGENGNGKSTLLKIVAGELRQTAGRLHYGSLSEQLHWPKIKSHIAYLPQELPKLEGTVRKNVSLQAALHGILGNRNTVEVDYILNRMGLAAYANHSWHELSGGYKLRFALTRILVWKPKLIILDEPLANLDINAQIMILNDLKHLAGSLTHPIAILMSSQNIKEIEAVAEKIMVLKLGQVQYYGRTDAIGNNRNENTYELMSPLSLQEMKNKLYRLPCFKVVHNGLTFVIDTPQHIDSLAFTKYCTEQNIPFTFFSDLSSSSKKIIYHNNLYA